MKDKIIEFIESYGHTLSAGDIQELEKFWEVPGVVVCDEGVRTLADTNALRRMDARSLDCIHRSEELTSATNSSRSRYVGQRRMLQAISRQNDICAIS